MKISSKAQPAGAPAGAAFLLAQLGTHAAGRFAERIEALGLTPAQGGLLRAIAAEPGCNQQVVAEQLGIHPSRLVALVDELERAGIIERRRNPQDRRHHALHLTEQGSIVLANLSAASAEHEADLCATLTDDERNQLALFLRRITDQQGLIPETHPGSADVGNPVPP